MYLKILGHHSPTIRGNANTHSEPQLKRLSRAVYLTSRSGYLFVLWNIRSCILLRSKFNSKTSSRGLTSSWIGFLNEKMHQLDTTAVIEIPPSPPWRKRQSHHRGESANTLAHIWTVIFADPQAFIRLASSFVEIRLSGRNRINKWLRA